MRQDGAARIVWQHTSRVSDGRDEIVKKEPDHLPGTSPLRDEKYPHLHLHASHLSYIDQDSYPPEFLL
jgi:hypothetical protein